MARGLVCFFETRFAPSSTSSLPATGSSEWTTRCYLTDAVLGESWGTDATLLKAREGWDGSEYPTIENGRRPSVPHSARGIRTMKKTRAGLNQDLDLAKREA